MKALNTYIQEGIKLSSKSKVSNKFESYILDILYAEPEDADPEEVKMINKWIKDNNVKYLTVVSTKDVLSNFGYNEENDNTIEELYNRYKDKQDINIVLDDALYDKLYVSIGKVIYSSKYGREEYYAYKNKLSFKFRNANYIFFISNDKLDTI